MRRVWMWTGSALLFALTGNAEDKNLWADSIFDPPGIVRGGGHPFLQGHERTEELVRGIMDGTSEQIVS